LRAGSPKAMKKHLEISHPMTSKNKE